MSLIQCKEYPAGLYNGSTGVFSLHLHGYWLGFETTQFRAGERKPRTKNQKEKKLLCSLAEFNPTRMDDQDLELEKARLLSLALDFGFDEDSANKCLDRLIKLYGTHYQQQ